MNPIRIALPVKNRFTREDLRELSRADEGPRLSIYAPLARTGREMAQAAILLKGLRSKASLELQARGVEESARADLLAPLDGILEEAELSHLQGEGLAVFSSAGYADAFLLPFSVPAAAEIDRRFRIDPILPLLFEEGRFHLLALSLNSVRLWEADREGMREIPLEGIPTNLKQAARFEDSEAYLSFHTGTASTGKDRRPAMFHGQGGGKGDVKEMKKDVLDFFHQLDGNLKSRLSDPGLPLMLAGVEYLQPLYREANSHPRLLPQAVFGNPEVSLSEHELHEKAWALFQKEILKERRRVLERYRERISMGGVSAGINAVVPLAQQGRVEILLMRKGLRLPGDYDPATGRVSVAVTPPSRAPGNGEEDLAASACAGTLLGDGKVYIFEAGEMPDGAEIAALCRY